MTYRDDTDAANARADALETDLRETEQERDELRREVEELRAKNVALVRAEPAALHRRATRR
jgi:hypothetical protein